MAQGYWHTYQVLTKRIERMREFFTKRDSHLAMTHCLHNFRDYTEPVGPWPLPNVWLGVSVENQKIADERVPQLLQTPATVRFVSYGPALGPVNFWKPIQNTKDPLFGVGRKHIDWVIAGGESGAGARPPHPDWFRSVRDQCKAAGVAFFFKQWGALQNGSTFGRLRDLVVLNNGMSGLNPSDFPREIKDHWGDFNPTMMGRVGKKPAGAILDGREHKEFPAAGIIRPDVEGTEVIRGKNHA